MYHHHQQLSMEVSDYFPKDHFIVEDLFNFSTDDPNDLSAADGGSSFDAAATNFTDSSSSGVNTGENYGASFTAYDFSEPTEEVAELEWLSNFVEDCFSNNSDHQFSASGSSSPAATATTPSQFTGMPQAAIPAKARSKRSRANPSSWAARLPVLSRVPAPEPAMSAGDVTAGRRCLHCGSEKTPQWRMGPMGPKTLCNACGVRYKSGRLVPEYRPAASPTFVMSEHSNSHRKVVELRRQKEEQQERRQQQHQQMMYWS